MLMHTSFFVIYDLQSYLSFLVFLFNINISVVEIITTAIIKSGVYKFSFFIIPVGTGSSGTAAICFL